MGIQRPAKGVVNKLLIVLKSEGLQMLLFQVKGAALSKSWLVFEDPVLQSGPGIRSLDTLHQQFRKEGLHFKVLFNLTFYLITYLLLLMAPVRYVCLEPNHEELGRLQRTTDRRLNAK